MSKKCHNCKNGQVDGGFSKRIRKEIISLELERNKRVESIPKDKIAQRESIELEYMKLIKDKSVLSPKIIGLCGYCHGKCTRINSYGVDPQ